MYMYIFVYVFVYLFIETYISINAYIYICIYICTYVYIYKYIHVCPLHMQNYIDYTDNQESRFCKESMHLTGKYNIKVTAS